MCIWHLSVHLLLRRWPIIECLCLWRANGKGCLGATRPQILWRNIDIILRLTHKRPRRVIINTSRRGHWMSCHMVPSHIVSWGLHELILKGTFDFIDWNLMTFDLLSINCNSGLIVLRMYIILSCHVTKLMGIRNLGIRTAMNIDINRFCDSVPLNWQRCKICR